jgi:hypothetical protein
MKTVRRAAFRDIARAKQLSRDADQRALASGQKSPDQLRRENGIFANAPVLKIRRDLAKPLK